MPSKYMQLWNRYLRSESGPSAGQLVDIVRLCPKLREVAFERLVQDEPSYEHLRHIFFDVPGLQRECWDPMLDHGVIGVELSHVLTHNDHRSDVVIEDEILDEAWKELVRQRVSNLALLHIARSRSPYREQALDMALKQDPSCSELTSLMECVPRHGKKIYRAFERSNPARADVVEFLRKSGRYAEPCWKLLQRRRSRLSNTELIRFARRSEKLRPQLERTLMRRRLACSELCELVTDTSSATAVEKLIRSNPPEEYLLGLLDQGPRLALEAAKALLLRAPHRMALKRIISTVPSLAAESAKRLLSRGPTREELKTMLLYNVCVDEAASRLMKLEPSKYELNDIERAVPTLKADVDTARTRLSGESTETVYREISRHFSTNRR